jgi:hypothetical protein
LRALYPHLTTRIFEIAAQRYVIWFDRDDLDADTSRDAFERSVKPVTVPVTITNTIPTGAVREIEPISDPQIAKGFESIQFSAVDLEIVLLSKFPDLPGPFTGSHSLSCTLPVCGY